MKFGVQVRREELAYVVIEAEDEEEAWEIAQDQDWEIPEDDWEWYSETPEDIEEVVG